MYIEAIKNALNILHLIISKAEKYFKFYRIYTFLK